MRTLFRGGRLLDPRRPELIEGAEILIEGDRIMEVAEGRISAHADRVLDLHGKVIMPGLIDCHVHLFLSAVNLRDLEDVPLTLLTARASVLAQNMLMRGFTTARDTGGADYGLREAIAQGLIVGPRLFIAGAPISQTGGHGDFRGRTQGAQQCACCSALSFTARVADGVPEAIKAARDELRKGADHLKIMCSGGVASQSDPLESIQFRIDEIEAICDEALRWNKYVAAHAYSAAAIQRAVSAGVRTIEHGNLIDEPTASLVAERKAFVVPTLVAYDALNRLGKDFGLSKYSQDKNAIVLEGGLRSLEICRNAGVEIGFGTDLLGQLQDNQSQEFIIRSEVLSSIEIIRSATLTNARILGKEGELGELVAGASADLLIVDEDPLKNLGVLQDQGAHISFIMKAGVPLKNLLN